MPTRAPRSPLSRQRGAMSVAIAVLVLLVMGSAVASLLVMSTSSTVDSAKQEEHTAALFLAESAIERAQGLVAAGTANGVFSSSTCTVLGNTSFSLGRGTAAYLSAAATPSACTASCTTCTVA